MPVLLDTNILLRLLQPRHPHGFVAETAIAALRGKNEVLNITSQNLVEAWAVMTRPLSENGLGFTVEQATAETHALKGLFGLLPELPLHDIWESLVNTHRVSGKNTHDARLVAAMLAHQIGSILTFNVQDFARYPQVAVIDPKTLSSEN